MSNIYQIAINTFRESIRSKILYIVLFFTLVLVLVSALFGSVTIGDQVKVIKDFGLFSISFFTVSFAVISGAALLHKELSKKTIFNILAKSVKRYEFVLGKYIGMLLTIGLMLIMMSAGLIGFIYLFEQSFDLSILTAIYFIFIQMLIICAAAIFFSSIVVTPMLSGAFTFAVFIAGRSSSYILSFAENESFTESFRFMVKGLYWLIPHLDFIDVSNQVVYDISLEPGFLFWSLVYGLGYAGILIMISISIFKRREFY